MKKYRPNNFDPFTDLLFNVLLGFTFLFFITILFINPISKLGNVNLKAEYIISVDWKDNLPDDVDLWVEDPNGEIVSYLKKDAGWLHLDRDDQGIINDKVLINDKEVIYPLNREVVTLRGIIPGEYIVNLYLYENKSSLPVDVKVKIERIIIILLTLIYGYLIYLVITQTNFKNKVMLVFSILL